MGKTALVTGACGFTGTHILELLAKEGGYSVIATDLKGSERKFFYTESEVAAPVYYEDFWRSLNMDIKFIHSDLTKKEELKPLFAYDIDVVFNPASLYDYFATLWGSMDNLVKFLRMKLLHTTRRTITQNRK